MATDAPTPAQAAPAAAAQAAPASTSPASAMTARAKGVDFVTEVEKLAASAKAAVLSDLGLVGADERKHPFLAGCATGGAVMAVVGLLLVLAHV